MRYPALRDGDEVFGFFFRFVRAPRRGDQPPHALQRVPRSSSPFTMSIGRGAMSGNVRGPSRNVVKPGQMASTRAEEFRGDLARTVRVSERLSFVRAAASNSAGGNESTRARHRSLRSAHPKSCAPMSARRRRSSRARRRRRATRTCRPGTRRSRPRASRPRSRRREIERRFVPRRRRARVGSAGAGGFRVVIGGSSVAETSVAETSGHEPHGAQTVPRAVEQERTRRARVARVTTVSDAARRPRRLFRGAPFRVVVPRRSVPAAEPPRHAATSAAPYPSSWPSSLREREREAWPLGGEVIDAARSSASRTGVRSTRTATAPTSASPRASRFLGVVACAGGGGLRDPACGRGTARPHPARSTRASRTARGGFRGAPRNRRRCCA